MSQQPFTNGLWFRPPRLVECAPAEFSRRFLWTCEPLRNQIFGASYSISDFLVYDPQLVSQIHYQACLSMLQRVINHECQDEASPLDAFLWIPNIIRHPDGSCTVS